MGQLCSSVELGVGSGELAPTDPFTMISLSCCLPNQKGGPCCHVVKFYIMEGDGSEALKNWTSDLCLISLWVDYGGEPCKNTLFLIKLFNILQHTALDLSKE